MLFAFRRVCFAAGPFALLSQKEVKRIVWRHIHGILPTLLALCFVSGHLFEL